MFGKIKLNLRSLSTLQLDTRNPRLSGYRKQGKLKTEKDIILVMLSNYDVKNLISSMLINGYHPDEVLFSIPSEKSNLKKVIVEGNRRLTACKILRKPEILEGTKYSYLIPKIKNHKNYALVLDTIKKINIIDLDNRSSARSYIASKHTKESIRRWSVYTQGAYYIDLLEEFDSINNLRVSINNSVSASRVKTVIMFSRIADQIIELPTLSDIEKEKIVSDIDNIKVEAILRLIQRTDFKKTIGIINLDNSGNLIVRKLSNEAYQIILAKLARDTNFSKTLSTRQEDEVKIFNYISELKNLIINFEDTSDEIFDEENNEEIDLNFLSGVDEQNENSELDIDESLTSEPPQPIIMAPTTAVENLKPKRKNPWLINKTTILTNEHTKLDDIIEEASRLNFTKFKHSSVLLSRTIIQILLTIFIQKSEFHDEYHSLARQKYLELDSLLDYFINNTKKILSCDLNYNNVKLIKETLSSYKLSGRVTANLATHSESHALTDQEITHIQAKLQILVDYFIPKLRSGQRADKAI